MYKSVTEAENLSLNLRTEIGRRLESVSHVENNRLHELRCRIKNLQERRAKYSESLSKGMLNRITQKTRIRFSE